MEREDHVSEHWGIIDCEEPIGKMHGPTFWLEFMPELIGTYHGCWKRWFEWVKCEDNESNRRKWRKRGYRAAKVNVSVIVKDET